MQTCSRCQRPSSDEAKVCSYCHSDLSEYSTRAVILKRFRENPRVVAIRISAPADACPVCQQAAGTYTKEDVSVLPIPGCSEPHGCMNFYEPVLDVIFP